MRDAFRQRPENSLMSSLSRISPGGVDCTNWVRRLADVFASAIRAASSSGGGSPGELRWTTGTFGSLGGMGGGALAAFYTFESMVSAAQPSMHGHRMVGVSLHCATWDWPFPSSTCPTATPDPHPTIAATPTCPVSPTGSASHTCPCPVATGPARW